MSTRAALGLGAALSLALSSGAARAQAVPGDASGAAATAALPRFAEAALTVPAAPGDVPGVSMAYGEPVEAPAPAAAAERDGYRAWGQYVFTTSRVGADANGAAIRSSSDGVSLGIERVVDPTFVVGASLGYAQGRTTSIGVRSDSESVSGAAYLWWSPMGGLEIDALAGATGLSSDVRRQVTLNGVPATLSGRSGGLGVSALGAVGYRFRLDGAAGPLAGAFVKPFLALAYAGQDRGTYAETAPGGGLYYPGRAFERATANLGAAFGTEIPTWGGWTLRPELSLAWSRHLIDPSPAVAAFDITTGRGFVLRDPRPGWNGALLAAELSVYRNAAVQAFVGYTGEFRANATAHQIRVGLRLDW